MFHFISAARIRVLVSLVLVVAASTLALAACREETDVGRERQGVPNASPTTLAGLPEGIEAVDIIVDGGRFDIGEIVLNEGQPTVLRIDNRDEETYLFRIDSLVTETEIPGDEQTQVNFTTPNAERYTAELLGGDGEEIVATTTVLVQAPGRTAP